MNDPPQLRRAVDQTPESICVLILLILIYALYIIVDFFIILMPVMAILFYD